ncbi:hypothetical protein [Mahella australiensis]|uniref:Uncharacterized protein n=1 Tax=Mahella australiensis (strain DSM 15567 / CIP 107919 / 50-1 BON) TaxID=697281 RepID=F4A0D4_MAHA5|nr:hypothetical protein [Mahella australiensis]AEE97995.1 hypothetical protein Mahau_2871 [Mahella australiensis 50-1 BON]
MISKNKNLLVIILILVIISLIISLAFNIFSHLKLTNIDNYFSPKVYEETLKFSTSALKTDKMLDDSLKNKQITIVNANILGNEFFNQAMNMDDLSRIYAYYAIKDRGIGNCTTVVLDNFSVYISAQILHRIPDTFNIAYDQKGVIKLSEDQITKFTKMKDINDKIVEITKKDVKGLTEYTINNSDFTSSNAVHSPLWEKLFVDLTNYCNAMPQWPRPPLD